MKQDIANRADVELLINTFYGAIREEEVLGPIFNKIIEDWDHHLALLADFWETNLFFVSKYKGNPAKVHQQVDEKVGGTITQDHFFRWITLWTKTVDSLFEGERANIAKQRARKMSTHLFINLFSAR